jgi:hypothetical protein
LKNFTFVILLFTVVSLSSQENKFAKGEIIDSINVNKAFNESFALYLPQQYEPSKLSAIIFIFDPAGRGKTGLKPFLKTADTHGYLLVCSNNTKNGPPDKNFEIVNRLFNKIFTVFNIDENRIYTSGFSGGARLASTIAVLTNKIQGVVACGAGFSPNSNQLPNASGFSYAAIVGNEDMNYLEMTKTKAWLDKLNISNELFVYNNDHRWPSQDQVLQAFDWLELEAIKKRIIAIDKFKIKNIYIRNIIQAKNNKNPNDLVSVENAYKRILFTFKDYLNLDSINTKITQFAKNKKLIKAKQELISNFNEEKILTDKFYKRFNSDFNRKTRIDLKWWKSELRKIKNKMVTANAAKKKMYKRLLYKIFAMAIETVSLTNKVEHIDQSVFCYNVCILIYPKNPGPYFKQIENFINKNDETTALNYLEKLIKSGYKNFNAIKDYKPFKTLKNKRKFIELLENN